MFRKLLFTVNGKKEIAGTFYPNNGGAIQHQIYQNGDVINEPSHPPPAYYNYLFTGWKNEKDGNLVSFPLKIRKDSVFYANYEWDNVNYKVKKSDNSGWDYFERIYYNGTAQIYAVAGDNYVNVSKDGTTWAQIPFDVDVNLIDLANVGNKLFALSDNKTICSATYDVEWNGLTDWNVFPNAITLTTPNAIAANGNRIVVVGGNSQYTVSDDGLTWTSPVSLSPLLGYQLNTIIKYNDGFIAGGDNGGIAVSSPATDPVLNWKYMSVQEVTTGNIVRFFYNGFVVAGAVRNGSNGQFIVSEDGINWTVRSIGASYPSSIVYGNGVWVIGANTGKIYYSTNDGETWAFVTVGENSDWSGAVFDGHKFVMTQTNGVHATSIDGINWTAIFTPKVGYENNYNMITTMEISDPIGYDFYTDYPVTVPSIPNKFYKTGGTEVFDGEDWDYFEAQTIPTGFITITFDSSGGSSINPQTVKSGRILSPVTTTKANYDFVNWTNNGEIIDIDKPVYKTMTLLANWSPKQYTVTFDVADGNGSFANQTITYGNKVVNPGNPSKQYYTFKHWTYLGTPFDFNTIITSDITLVATYEKELYTQSGSASVRTLASYMGVVSVFGIEVTFPIPFSEIVSVTVNNNINVPSSSYDYSENVHYQSFKNNNKFGQTTGSMRGGNFYGTTSGEISWTATGYRI